MPLALARVQPGAQLQPQRADVVDERAGTVDRTPRAVKCSEEAVTGCVEVGAPEVGQSLADERVMPVQELPPDAVAELGSALRRADDVREEHGDQNALRCALPPKTRDKAFRF